MPTRIPCKLATVRKRPLQARSRATIDAIIDATARILQHRSLAEFNTNLVAEIAGVSIGTLYQYFSNKTALLEALRERHLNEILLTLRVSSSPTFTRAKRINLFADGIIKSHTAFPPSFHDISNDLLEKRAADTIFKPVYETAYRSFVEANSLSAHPSILLSKVLSSSVTSTVHDAATEGFLDNSAFKTEFLKMLNGLLG